MVSYKVYKPTSNDIPVNIETPREIDKPDYPDIGVKYAGYSKTLISKNNYRLNPQTPWSYTQKTGTLAPGTTIINYLANPPEGKKLYITGLQMGCSVSAIDANTYFKIDSTTGTNVTLFQIALLRSEWASYTFNPPLVVDLGVRPNVVVGEGVAVTIASAGVTINQCSYNLQGWIE